MPVQTHYARNGEVSIAYQAIGQGAFDLVFVPGFISNLELHWEDPGYALLLRRLSAFSRLIQFDKRGTGLSDRVSVDRLPDLGTRMDDVRAVMDACGSGRAALLGASEGAPMAVLFAVTYPERTRALVLYGGYAHFHRWVLSAAALADFIAKAETEWGSGVSLASFAPGRVRDPHFSQWWARFERLSASPSAAIALARMNATIDIRDILGQVTVPTLIVYRRDDARVDPAASRYLASHIPGARLVEIAGSDHPIWTGDVAAVVDQVEQFLTGTKVRPKVTRTLAALLCSRIVAAERAAARCGDVVWLETLERFHATAKSLAERNDGAIWSWDGDRLGAHFNGSAKAIEVATELREAAVALGLSLAQGVHVGEIESGHDGIAGVAIHMTDRIADEARAGEVLCSPVVSDLAAGSGLLFGKLGRPVQGDRGGQLPLLAVATERHLEPAGRHRGEQTLGKLSGREREILALVAAGLSNPAIAARFKLSEHTVKRHVANILLKLDLKTRAAAAALAARQTTT